MTTTQSLKRSPWLFTGCAAIVLSVQPFLMGEVSESVASSVNEHYSRAKLADGSFRPEIYSFGEGGVLGGAASTDVTDHLSFKEVARAAVRPLAEHNYLPAVGSSPEKTNLLIMVYWGTTNAPSAAGGSTAYQRLQAGQGALTNAPPPPEISFIAHCSCDSPQVDGNFASVGNGIKQNEVNSAFAAVAAEDRIREQADMRIATLLGYDSELFASSALAQTAFRNRRQDMITEIEQSRDFIVLIAFDFHDLWKNKRRTAVWVTRLSVPEHGLTFRNALPAMVLSASDYFGRDSHGLVREYLRGGRVDVGDSKVLGEVAAK